MSRTTTCPQIIHDVQNYSIVQEKPFSIDISVLFKPDDGTLRFYLKNTSLPWLHLDQYTGVLRGIAPKVPYNKSFKFSLVASNEMGFVTKSFIITVIDTEITENMVQTLELILSKRRQYYGYHHLHPYTPSLLEHLYHFFKQPKYCRQFIHSIQIAASNLAMKISDEVTYQEFASVLTEINPNLEHQLKEALNPDKIAMLEEIHHDELQTVFHDHEKSSECIAIPVWSHCMSTELPHNPQWHVLLHAMNEIIHILKSSHEPSFTSLHNDSLKHK